MSNEWLKCEYKALIKTRIILEFIKTGKLPERCLIYEPVFHDWVGHMIYSDAPALGLPMLLAVNSHPVLYVSQLNLFVYQVGLW